MKKNYEEKEPSKQKEKETSDKLDEEEFYSFLDVLPAKKRKTILKMIETGEMQTSDVLVMMEEFKEQNNTTTFVKKSKQHVKKYQTDITQQASSEQLDDDPMLDSTIQNESINTPETDAITTDTDVIDINELRKISTSVMKQKMKRAKN